MNRALRFLLTEGGVAGKQEPGSCACWGKFLTRKEEETPYPAAPILQANWGTYFFIFKIGNRKSITILGTQ